MDIGTLTTQAGIAAEVKPKLDKLKETTKGIESIFIKQILAEMRKTVSKVEFGDSAGAEIYQDMMDHAIAEAGSKTGSFGLSQTLYRSFAPRVLASETANLKKEIQSTLQTAKLLAQRPNPKLKEK